MPKMEDETDVYDLKQGHVVNEWLVWKNLGPNINKRVYQVSDLKMEKFGKMYIEKTDDEDLSMLMESINFLSAQQWIGNSFRFSTIIDAQLIENQYVYMVVQDRPGPTLQQLLNCEKANNCFTPSTCAYFAIDFIQTIEAIVNSGHVLRNFDPNQWKFDTNSRVFYLADVSDVVTSSDKRCNIFKEEFSSTHLKWRGNLRYAPISFSKLRDLHRMNELDMIEMAIFVLYNLVVQKLPWDTVYNQSKVITQKQNFLFDWTKHLDNNLQMFETTLRNMAQNLKQAATLLPVLEASAVVEGAWCPNGTRAGALPSAINYAAIIEDFHTIIMHDQSIINWREAVLCFEVEIDPALMTPEEIESSKALELSKHFSQELETQKRNVAMRAHYEVLVEDHEAELKINLENAKNSVNSLVETTEKGKVSPKKYPRKKRGPYNKKKIENVSPKKRGQKERVHSPVLDEETDEEIEKKPEVVTKEDTIPPKKRENKRVFSFVVEDKTPKKRGRKKKIVSPEKLQDAPKD